MKTFEERYTAWVDGLLPEPEKEAFEREYPDLAGECEQMGALRGLLREQLRAPQLAHPEFFNSELLRQIEREQAAAGASRTRRTWLGWPRLAWAGVGLGSAAVAAVLALTFVPHKNTTDQGDYVAEVLKAQTSDPSVKATVDAKKDVTIIKLDGLEKVPPDKDLK
ncbi:MAG: hypothetical protein JO069_09855 [Verrucomicrobia bacterium]|nr:hypothetical protein [Verrucomicrobiota bacterium]